MQLQDRVALVTGAGSGIGAAAARLLAREGAKVAVLGRTEDKLRKTADAIRAHNVEVMSIAADISQPDSISRAVEQIIQQWGRLDIVFANAGINGVWAPLEDLTPEDWDTTLNVNLKGTFLTVKYALPYLKRQGGSVIITSSINGTRVFSNSGATAYSCSKAAQVAFARMVALEVAPHRVRVNVICPGAIDTDINDSTEKRRLETIQPQIEFPKGEVPLTAGRPGTSEQVAELVVFLASDAASHITGTEIWIDGAQSLLRG